MTSKSPAMQFYPGDFLADTMYLSDEELACYMRLLCQCWIGVAGCDQGWLPNDEKKLARMAHKSLRKWREIYPAVIDLFKLKKPDKIGHKRCLEELGKQRNYREQRRLAGIQSGKSRQRVVNARSTTVAPPLERDGQRKRTLQSSSSSSSIKEGEGSGVLASPSPSSPPREFMRILKDRGIMGSSQQIRELAEKLTEIYSLPALTHTLERYAIKGIDVFVLERRFGNGLLIVGAKGCKKCDGSGEDQSAGYSPGAGRYPYCVCVKAHGQ